MCLCVPTPHRRLPVYSSSIHLLCLDPRGRRGVIYLRIRGTASVSRSRDPARLASGGGPGCGRRRTSAAVLLKDIRGRGKIRRELARYKYGASLSFHGEGEGAPSFQQLVLISCLALDFYKVVNLHPAASMAPPHSRVVRLDHLSLQNGFPERYRRAVKAGMQGTRKG